ncbi:ABC transporter ATP-binding protein, partial [Streptomyces sp. PD-S100-1]
MSIRFDSVTVAYDGNVVLDSLDLTVAPGEVMALLGPSGSGKTTALRAVAGFVRPASGRVLLGGRDVTDLPPHRRGIGMVVQQYALFPHLRVEDNVAFGLRARRTPRAEIRERVAEALEMTGMAAYARRYPRELSGGQQQRVAIARALAVRPAVLLLDEPLSALDARLRSGMLAELARLHRELPDVSILYVTHDQMEALTLADRIAVMDKARLRACGTPRELYRAPADEFTASFVGNANLLPVTVTASGAALGDARLTVDTAGAAAGARATLCVRPHLVGLGDGPNRLTGTVREIQWRGSTHRLHVDVAGHAVMADLPELRDPPAHGA